MQSVLFSKTKRVDSLVSKFKFFTSIPMHSPHNGSNALQTVCTHSLRTGTLQLIQCNWRVWMKPKQCLNCSVLEILLLVSIPKCAKIQISQQQKKKPTTKTNYGSMRIVRFHLEPWQKGGSIRSGFSSPSSVSSLPILSDSVLRRQRCPSSDDLSNIDTNLFERRSTSHSSNSRHSSYSKRKLPQMVKRLTVLCSDVLARNVMSNQKSIFGAVSFFEFNVVVFRVLSSLNQRSDFYGLRIT